MTENDEKLPAAEPSAGDEDDDFAGDDEEQGDLETGPAQKILTPILVVIIGLVALLVGSVPFLILYTVFMTAKDAREY